MKTITKDTIIVKKFTDGDIREEYRVQKNTSLTLIYVVSGSRDIVVRPSVHLVGVGAKATVVGLVKGSGNSKISIHTLQRHVASNTTSNLLVKCIMKDESHCSYTGSILVEKSAQKTDAYQRNENLLMDDGAHATSSPALEILANDVRCTHGATVKTLDENELWYLASRGIDRTQGRAMIADGFLKSALTNICLTPKQYKTIFPS